VGRAWSRVSARNPFGLQKGPRREPKKQRAVWYRALDKKGTTPDGVNTAEGAHRFQERGNKGKQKKVGAKTQMREGKINQKAVDPRKGKTAHEEAGGYLAGTCGKTRQQVLGQRGFTFKGKKIRKKHHSEKRRKESSKTRGKLQGGIWLRGKALAYENDPRGKKKKPRKQGEPTETSSPAGNNH